MARVLGRQGLDDRRSESARWAGRARRRLVQRFAGRADLRLLQLLGLCQPLSVLEQNRRPRVSGLERKVWRPAAAVPGEDAVLLRRQRQPRTLWAVADLSLGSTDAAGAGVRAG